MIESMFWFGCGGAIASSFLYWYGKKTGVFKYMDFKGSGVEK